MVKKNLLFVVFLVVTICIASAFQFSPLEQTFEPTGENAQKTYTIVNDSDDQIAISLSVLVRDQDADGNEVRSDASAQFQRSLSIPSPPTWSGSSTWVPRP